MSNDDLDESLRSALRPLDPGEQFTRDVMAAISRDSQPIPTGTAPPKVRVTFRWASAAFVISLVLGVVTAHQWQLRRQERGLEARRQLLQALQVAGEKLDLAYRVVNDEERRESAP
jgi:hypothetical protein